MSAKQSFWAAGNHKMKNLGVVALCTLLANFISNACAADCKSIADPAARLACFDAPKVAKDAPKAAKKLVTADPYAPAKIAMARKLTDPESARWGEFYSVVGDGGYQLICGAVNSKNRMGGYVGMTGFTYEPKTDRAILLFSGNTDGDAGIATRMYRAYCLDDPRADRRIASP
jgi:hypothetical protein